LFKSFQNNRRSNGFNGFPSLNFQMNNEAYGFSGCSFWLDAAYGLNTQTDLAAVSSWRDKIRGIEFTQNTVANQCTWKNSLLAFNNLPAIFIALDNKFMTTTQPIGISSNFTIAVIGQRTAVLDQIHVLLNASLGTTYITDTLVWGGNFSANTTGIGLYSGFAQKIVSTVEDTNPHIAVLTNTEIAIDGVQVATGSVSSFGPIQALGYNNIVGSFGGYVGEIIIWGGVRHDAVSVCNAINQKYAIY